MKASFHIEERKPIWTALSEFYLDTELDESALRHIAFTITDSPYTFEEVRRINKYEVFPVLQPNLLSYAGIWAGFDENWLVERITTRLRSRNVLKDAGLELSYLAFGWMCKRYWQRLEEIYNDIRANPDSFIVLCRRASTEGVHPFQFEKAGHPVYRKLYETTLGYRDTSRWKEFYQFLNESRYDTNIWTAYFLLEVFDLERSAQLDGLKDKESVFDHCYHLIENTFQSFKDKNQIRNCSYWLEEKRRATKAI